MFEAPRTSSDVPQLQRRLALLFGVTWLTLAVLLGGVTTWLYDSAGRADLDHRLRLAAMAAYGLAYFDAAGVFHADLFEAERADLPRDTDIWVIAPDHTPVVALSPGAPHCALRRPLVEAAPVVVRDELSDFVDLTDASGRDCRVRRLRTYTDDGSTIAAIFAATPTQARDTAVRDFALRLWLGIALVVLIGLGASSLLARWAVRPLDALIEEREHLLRAAAHELKTPLARLRVTTEAREDVPPELAEALLAIVDDADRAALSLLRAAELSAAPARPTEQLRLDLLVESVVDPDRLRAEPVVIEGDAEWLRIAVENLWRNAEEHAGGATEVIVDATGVRIRDAGPGFEEAMLNAPIRPFRRGARSRGTGLGLSLAQRVAEQHGGGVERHNLDAGAEVWLRLRAD